MEYSSGKEIFPKDIRESRKPVLYSLCIIKILDSIRMALG
ncbi:hypothetical protein LEP1GSC061_1856 [Leptospira wolffii serovar Khorat str. Khorat-H2]|nr:hypothetical protein LEP1GSC061_1856 [Leptospira wolffii serovar Khorat str. Khorat-H2]